MLSQVKSYFFEKMEKLRLSFFFLINKYQNLGENGKLLEVYRSNLQKCLILVINGRHSKKKPI